MPAQLTSPRRRDRAAAAAPRHASSPVGRWSRRRSRQGAALVAGPTPHISPTGRSCRKAISLSGSTTTSPSGFATCDAILARCLVRATPIEIGRPFRPHPSPHRGGDLGRRPEQVRTAGDVGKGLVDGDPLDQRREIVEHLDGGVAQPLVVAEMTADEDELGIEFARPPSRHAAAHAEGPGFVGCGEHDTAANGDRLAAQRRIEQLLDRGIEGVEIRMQDAGFHPTVACGMESRVCFKDAWVEQIEYGGILSSFIPRISFVLVRGQPPGRDDQQAARRALDISAAAVAEASAFSRQRNDEAERAVDEGA